MDLRTAHRWADSAGKPNPTSLARAGYVGIFLYGGTPGEPKNCTPQYYQACRAAGLQTAWWFENIATDYIGGYEIGRTHGLRLLSDMTVCRAGLHEPAGATVDTHLAAGDIATAVEYQRGFWSACHGHPVVAYGFREFLDEVINHGVAEVFVQAGDPHLVDGDIHFWQDNGQQPIIAGVQIDVDWQLLPLPEVPAMQQTDKIDQNAAPGTVGRVLRDLEVGFAGVNPAGPLALLVMHTAEQVAQLAADVAAIRTHLGLPAAPAPHAGQLVDGNSS